MTPLTTRQLVVAALYVNGVRMKDVAMLLGYSRHTVVTMLRKVRAKFRANGVDAGTQVLFQVVMNTPGMWYLRNTSNSR